MIRSVASRLYVVGCLSLATFLAAITVKNEWTSVWDVGVVVCAQATMLWAAVSVIVEEARS